MTVVTFILQLVNLIGWILVIAALVRADWRRVREPIVERAKWPWNSPIFDRRGRKPMKWGLWMELITWVVLIALRGSIFP